MAKSNPQVWPATATDHQSGILCRQMAETEIDGVVRLMCLSGFNLGGEARPRLYRSLCREALRGGKVLVEVADSDGDLRGFVAAIIDWRYHWCRFLLMHPIFASRVLWHRLKRAVIGRPVEDCLTSDEEFRLTGLIGDLPSGRSWGESNRRIAKIVFIYVGASARGQGIGGRLYQRLFERLRRQGVKRCDARIAYANLGSVRLHLQAGFVIERTVRSLFATANL